MKGVAALKRFIILVALMGVLITMSPSLAQAAPTGPVNATVTARLISVNVTENNVAYGVLNIGTEDAEPTDQNCATSTSAFTVANNGNDAQDFNIKGFDSSGGWALLGTAGDEEYVHRFSTASNPCVFTTNEIGTSDATLETGIASSSSFETYLNLDMPTSTIVTDEQTLAITITAISAS